MNNWLKAVRISLTIAVATQCTARADDSEYTVKIIKTHAAPGKSQTTGTTAARAVAPGAQKALHTSSSTAQKAAPRNSAGATVTTTTAPAKPASSGQSAQSADDNSASTPKYTTRVVHGAPPTVVVTKRADRQPRQTTDSISRRTMAGSPNQTPTPRGTAATAMLTTPRTSSPSHTVLDGQVGELDEANIATVNDGAFQARIQSSDSILQTAPPLPPYEKGVVTGGAFRAFLQANHTQVTAGTGDLVVFKGKWDKAEHLLSQCGLRFTDGNSHAPEGQLANAKVVLVDCPGELSDRTLLALREFVKRGGYLITTDYALGDCIEKAFPGFLVFKGAYSTAGTMDAVPVLPGNPWLKGINGVAPWRLADKCEIAELGGAGAVDVLMRSRSLANQDPNRLGILAASFTYGTGKVLHLVGHFDNNEGLAFVQLLPDPYQPIKISVRQAIAINFIAEALQGIKR